MLSTVQKYIDSLSSIPHLEALQEACQLFEKEREQWKQERLALLKRIEALEAVNKQLRDQLALNSQNSSKPPLSCLGLKRQPFMITGRATNIMSVIMAFAMRIIYVNLLGPMNKKRPSGLRR